MQDLTCKQLLLAKGQHAQTLPPRSFVNANDEHVQGLRGQCTLQGRGGGCERPAQGCPVALSPPAADPSAAHAHAYSLVDIVFAPFTSQLQVMCMHQMEDSRDRAAWRITFRMQTLRCIVNA